MQDTYTADPSSDSANVIVLHWPGFHGFGKYSGNTTGIPDGSQTSRDYFQLVQLQEAHHFKTAEVQFLHTGCRRTLPPLHMVHCTCIGLSASTMGASCICVAGLHALRLSLVLAADSNYI